MTAANSEQTAGTLSFIVNSGFVSKIVYYENYERKECTCKITDIYSLSFVVDLPFATMVYIPLRYIVEIKTYQHAKLAEIFIGDTNGHMGDENG